jgi:hypothetical protein
VKLTRREAGGALAELDQPAEPAAPGAPVPPSDADLREAEPLLDPLGGPARAGRSAAPLEATEWRARWQAELPAGETPSAAVAGDRVVAMAGPAWRLLDLADGAPVCEGEARGGFLAVDPQPGLVYVAVGPSRLSAVSLASGTPAFELTLGGTQTRLVDRLGDGLLVVSSTRAGLCAQLFRGAQGSGGGSPSELAEALRGAEEAARLDVTGKELRVASRAGRLHLAAGSELWQLEPDLSLARRVDLGHPILALSCAPGGAALLILEREGRRTFASVGPNGGRWAQHVPLPDAPPLTPRPPRAGVDRVWLEAEDRFVALDPSGAVLWRAPTRGPVAGAVALDRRLLAAERDRLVVYGDGGDRRQLHHLSGRDLVGAPALSPHALVALTAGAVHALVPQT